MTAAALVSDCTDVPIPTVPAEGQRVPRARGRTKIPQWQAGPQELLEALQAKNETEVERLMQSEDAAALLTARNRHGGTPLMLAASGRCSEDMALRIVARVKELCAGTVAASVRSAKGHTAADYADYHQTRPSLALELRTWEREESAAAGSPLCSICRAVIPKRCKLNFMVERTLRGEEDTPRLQDFLASENGAVKQLLRPEFHTLSDDKQLRKKIASSLAILEVLYALVDDVNAWHIVDLCCGKSLTAALVAAQFPRVFVTAVDRRAGLDLPHYAEVGLGAAVDYKQMDVLADDFVERLSALVESQNRPTAILGIHLCGRLSERAIEAFTAISHAPLCLLMPCCLPNMAHAPEQMLHLYRTGETLRAQGDRNEYFDPVDVKQYEAWSTHLTATLQRSGDVEVRGFQDKDTLSKKCRIIAAVKEEATGLREALRDVCASKSVTMHLA